MFLLVVPISASQTGAQWRSIIVPLAWGPHRQLTHKWVCLHTRGQVLTYLFSPVAFLKDFIHTHVSPWCVKINSPFPDEWSEDNYSGSDQCWIDTYTHKRSMVPLSSTRRTIWAGRGNILQTRASKKKNHNTSNCLLLEHSFLLIKSTAIFRFGHFHLSSNCSSVAGGVLWGKTHIC